MIEAGIPARISDNLRIVYQAATAVQDHDLYRPYLRALTARQVALYEEAIRSGVSAGAFEARMEVSTIAENLVALEDAYDLNLLGSDNGGRARYLVNAIAFAELALSCRLTESPTPGRGEDMR